MSTNQSMRMIIDQWPGPLPHHISLAMQSVVSFIEAHEPWYPPQQEGFGPWIEYKPGDKGPHVGEHVITLEREERARRKVDSTCSLYAHSWSWAWDNSGSDVVAYCVKLDEAKP